MEQQSVPRTGKWTERFILAAMIQGAGAVIWTVPIVLPTVTPAIAQVIAAGDAGTWFTIGYLAYIMIGVIATAVSALFYRTIEVDLNRPYRGIANYLAWAHLLLMNVGAAVATWLMMYGGYVGGAAMLPTSEGGGGQTALQVHVNILGVLVDPIGYAVIAVAMGVLAGGLGYVISSRRRPSA